MKVRSVSYTMLRSTRAYENDRAEVVVDVGGKGTQADVDAAFAEAKRQCAMALGKPTAEVREAVRQAKASLDRIVG